MIATAGKKGIFHKTADAQIWDMLSLPIENAGDGICNDGFW